jgi:hypothetical protein
MQAANMRGSEQCSDSATIGQPRCSYDLASKDKDGTIGRSTA